MGIEAPSMVLGVVAAAADDSIPRVGDKVDLRGAGFSFSEDKRDLDLSTSTAGTSMFLRREGAPPLTLDAVAAAAADLVSGVGVVVDLKEAGLSF